MTSVSSSERLNSRMNSVFNCNVYKRCTVCCGRGTLQEPFTCRGNSKGEEAYSSCEMYVDFPAHWDNAMVMESEKLEHSYQMYHMYELSCEKYEQTYAYQRIVLMNEDCPITKKLRLSRARFVSRCHNIKRREREPSRISYRKVISLYRKKKLFVVLLSHM